MLEFLNNNRQRILSPVVITLALYVVAALELPSKYNYLVPSLSEIFIILLFFLILSAQERIGEWRKERHRNSSYNKLKSSLSEKLEMKRTLSEFGGEVSKKIDSQAISILEEMHRYEADEIKSNREEYNEITAKNEKIKQEKTKYKKEAAERTNALVDKVQQSSRNLK